MAKQEVLETGVLVSLTPHEVKERFEVNDVVIVDVRTPVEYAFEHIPGAMLFPLASFNPAKLPVQTGKPIVFHCGTGKRSTAAAAKCIAAGIAEVIHIDGGLGAWKSAGLTFATIDPPTGNLIEKTMPVEAK
jgi:rhodanese-related sulfurtransferase